MHSEKQSAKQSENLVQNRTKKLTALAMLTAMSFIVGATIRIRDIFPAANFLTYDPKDVVILIGGFMFGPLSALAMSVVVALLEMITISRTGPWGALMNAVSSASFTCTAAFIYSKRRDLKGAVIGLALGCIVATGTMLLWNYAVIPLYSPAVTRERVMGMMLPALLPFNLLKTSLNAALTLLVYKKVSDALKAAGLYREAFAQGKSDNRRLGIAVMVVSAVIAAVLGALIFILRASGGE